jgi:hypothetical protein
VWICQINHLFQFQLDTDEHFWFHIAQRKVVIGETGIALLDGRFLSDGKIHSPRNSRGQSSSTHLQIAPAVEKLCQPGKLQRRGSKCVAPPFAIMSLELLEFRDEDVKSGIEFNFHCRAACS